jgi:hypothetical protein
MSDLSISEKYSTHNRSRLRANEQPEVEMEIRNNLFNLFGKSQKSQKQYQNLTFPREKPLELP